MDYAEIIVIYTCVWWISFFMALPIALKISEQTEEGHADSAPENPAIAKKAFWVTILSIPITTIIIYLLHSGIFSTVFDTI